VRVLIPCYKESLQVVMSTVGAALEADLPPGAQRTIYLCDDGKDKDKEAFISKLGSKAVYVSGERRRAAAAAWSWRAAGGRGCSAGQLGLQHAAGPPGLAAPVLQR
jgi:hypothetical protein